MKKFAFSPLRAAMISALWWISCPGAAAMSPAELQRQLAGGTRITVIDIRSTAIFQKGHIPGAINVPSALIPEKELPPLGKVVVCDEGLGQTTAESAVAVLNLKKGIAAEVLEGGFAGWEALQGTTTREPGLQKEELNLITFDQLKKTNPAELVLVDLRKPRSRVRPSGQNADAPAPPPLTDLQKEFPQVPITRSPFDVPQARQGETERGKGGPVLVLIDDGGPDNSAQEMARTLKANGIKRVVILAGGEEILSRGGRPGLQRTGTAIGVQEQKK